MSITVSGPAYVTPGSDITYEITVKNLTNQRITDIGVFSALPDNTTYVSGGNFIAADNGVEFPLFNLEANASRTLTWVVNVDDDLQNPSVNHRLKLESSTATYDSTPQANAPAGVYHIEAVFSNVTEVSLEDLYFTVANLTTGNVLLNADGGSAGVGARLSVPGAALGSDSILHSSESFTFTFDVGLAGGEFSTLTVDANGVPHDWIHPDPAPSYDANNASFVFGDVTFLPVIMK